jgi:hypothetical protein
VHYHGRIVGDVIDADVSNPPLRVSLASEEAIAAGKSHRRGRLQRVTALGRKRLPELSGLGVLHLRRR